MGLTTFSGSQPTLKEAVVAKNYLNKKELRAMGQLVSGYLDFAERQAEREQAMTMQNAAAGSCGGQDHAVERYSDEYADG